MDEGTHILFRQLTPVRCYILMVVAGMQQSRRSSIRWTLADWSPRTGPDAKSWPLRTTIEP